MSTKRSHLWAWRFVLAVGVIAVCYASASAQEIKLKIRVLADGSRVAVEGSCPPRSTWSFVDSYAGVIGLGRRVDSFKAFDQNGAEVFIRVIAPGQFESTAPATTFAYKVNVTPPMIPSDAAKISWVNSERGVLMLRDLLPALAGKGTIGGEVKLDLPLGWRAYANDGEIRAGDFTANDFDVMVIAIGKDLRQTTRSISDATLSLVTDGQWAFTDDEAIDLAAKILKTHRELFGTTAARRMLLIVFPFPQPTSPNIWNAETRGSTVTLLIGKHPSKTAALAQLSTPLTHELFHLWVPNGLALEGDYDWFYEGFTVYEAARTAVRLDLLTFQEFLDSIARAYDASAARGESLSLIDASARRFTTGQTWVYSKSQVIAFIYDLRMRASSHGKKSLDDVYRRLFRQYQSIGASPQNQLADGNNAITGALSSEIGSEDFVRTYIRTPVSIDLAVELDSFGLKTEKLGLRTRIFVDEKLTKRQHDLLRELGYNDATHAVRMNKKK